MLSNLMQWQLRLMKVLGISAKSKLPFYERPEFINAVIGIAKEALEVHDAISNDKPWKAGDTVWLAREELVDVFFMLLEAFLLAGLTAKDVESLYLQKYAKNLKRAKDAGRTVTAQLNEFHQLTIIRDGRMEQAILFPLTEEE